MQVFLIWIAKHTKYNWTVKTRVYVWREKKFYNNFWFSIKAPFRLINSKWSSITKWTHELFWFCVFVFIFSLSVWLTINCHVEGKDWKVQQQYFQTMSFRNDALWIQWTRLSMTIESNQKPLTRDFSLNKINVTNFWVFILFTVYITFVNINLKEKIVQHLSPVDDLLEECLCMCSCCCFLHILNIFNWCISKSYRLIDIGVVFDGFYLLTYTFQTIDIDKGSNHLDPTLILWFWKWTMNTFIITCLQPFRLWLN